jgi:hypothetical protein
MNIADVAGEQAKNESTDGLLPLDTATLCIHWERDEFRRLVEQQDLSWPSAISHKKLRLIKCRYPIVPEFNNKLRDDEYVLKDLVVEKPKKGKVLQLKRRKLYTTIETSQYSNKSWKRKTLNPDRQIQVKPKIEAPRARRTPRVQLAQKAQTGKKVQKKRK